jgi:hypothetical protein
MLDSSHMPPPFTVTGGAHIGWTNASWPLAQLSATHDKLTLSVSLLGTYSFAPDQVSAVERHVMIPVLAWGIRIRHRIADYPQRVIFWCFGNPDRVLRGIRDSGFLATASGSEVPQRRGMAMRWSAIIVAVATWNVLFLLDRARSSGVSPRPGPFSLVALLFIFALSISLPMSSRLQRLILKPGRSAGELRPFLRLLALVSGILLLFFSMFLIFGVFA